MENEREKQRLRESIIVSMFLNQRTQLTGGWFFMSKRNEDGVIMKLKRTVDFELLAEEYILIRESEVSYLLSM